MELRIRIVGIIRGPKIGIVGIVRGPKIRVHDVKVTAFGMTFQGWELTSGS